MIDKIRNLFRAKQKKSITLEEYIKYRTSQGTSKEILKKELLEDFDKGGPVFKDFRQAIKATVRSQAPINDKDLGVITKYKWSAVLINTCEDCIKLHGQVKTWEEWEAEGLPRTKKRQTKCREECRCVLLPAEFKPIES